MATSSAAVGCGGADPGVGGRQNGVRNRAELIGADVGRGHGWRGAGQVWTATQGFDVAQRPVGLLARLQRREAVVQLDLPLTGKVRLAAELRIAPSPGSLGGRRPDATQRPDQTDGPHGKSPSKVPCATSKRWKPTGCLPRPTPCANPT